jgi:hypothetical protein
MLRKITTIDTVGHNRNSIVIYCAYCGEISLASW